MAVKIARPVDAPEKLKAKGMPLDEYGSCAEPTRDGSVIGCNKWHMCPWKKGPFYVPYRMAKSESMGGGLKEDVAPCYVAIKKQIDMEANGGAVEFLDVDKVTVRVSKKENPALPSSPFTDTWEEREVPAWDGLDGNRKLVDKLYAAKIRERFDEQNRDDKIKKAFANPAEDPPVERKRK